MLNITPKGYTDYNGSVITIPFKDVKSESELENILKNKFELCNGVLIHNYNRSQLYNYFEDAYLVKPDKIINIDYINAKTCVSLNVELLDKNTTVYMYMHDNLKNALFSLHFLFKHRRYRFSIDNIEVDVNDIFSNIIKMDKKDETTFNINITIIE
jgi:hypothetical protein